MKHWTIALLISVVCYAGSDDFAPLVGLHEPLANSVQEYLTSMGMLKTIWYYDDVNQKDGNWELYPFANLDSNHIIVNIAKTDATDEAYNFLIVLKTIPDLAILDTIGPFYDDFVVGVYFQDLRNEQGQRLNLRIYSEPSSEDESPHYIVSYRGQDYRFIKVDEVR